MTVTGVTEPVSESKTWVIPNFLPMMPFIASDSRAAENWVGTKASDSRAPWGPPNCFAIWSRSPSQLDLDVDAGRKVEPHQRVDGLRCRRVDVDQPFVRAHLEVLARVLVLERRPDHAVDVLLGGQRNGTGDGGAGSLSRLDDRLSRLVDLLVVVALQPDADFLSQRTDALST